MEKKLKSPNPGGRKRQRKTSLTAPSEPKNIKLDAPDALSRLKSSQPAVPTSKKPKLKKKDKPKLVELPMKNKPAKADTQPTNSVPGHTDTKVQSQQVVPKKQKAPKPNANLAKKKQKKVNIIPLPLKKKNKKEPAKTEEDLVEKSDTELETEKEAPTNENKQLTKAQLVKELNEKYPILQDMNLISRFLKVPLNNNQKGRIRLAIRQSLQGSSQKVYPDIINGKIQAILSSSTDLTDSDLRKIRILYNMLKTALTAPDELEVPAKKISVEKCNESGDNEKKKNKNEEKKKGPKRYVVFLGNLPLDINKEKIMEHFRELNEHIKDIRLPKLADGTKSAIAYVELSNEPSFELALSKHHSMLGNKRIKVLYTTQQKSKISRTEAKGKSAKLIALQKSGKLVGSTPLNKKRSHRRKIMKQARKRDEPADT